MANSESTTLGSSDFVAASGVDYTIRLADVVDGRVENDARDAVNALGALEPLDIAADGDVLPEMRAHLHRILETDQPVYLVIGQQTAETHGFLVAARAGSRAQYRFVMASEVPLYVPITETVH